MRDVETLQIYALGVKNQQLMSRYLDMGWAHSARQLQQIDALLAGLLAAKGGYKPNQPRVPAGNPDGGQWTDGDGSTTLKPLTPEQEARVMQDAIDSVYPIENALALLTGGEIVVALRAMVRGRAAIAASSGRIQSAAKSIEDWLGGAGKFYPSRAGDMIVQRGRKKIRFDIKGKGKDKPHFHLEKDIAKDNWKNAGSKHRYYFRED